MRFSIRTGTVAGWDRWSRVVRENRAQNRRGGEEARGAREEREKDRQADNIAQSGFIFVCNMLGIRLTVCNTCIDCWLTID